MKRMNPRADAIVLPKVKGAEEKAKREKALMEKYNFEDCFKSMGLNSEDLEVAMLRKKRSLMSLEAEEERAKAEALKPVDLSKAKEERISVLRKFLRAPMYEQGWSPATGTMVL